MEFDSVQSDFKTYMNAKGKELQKGSGDYDSSDISIFQNSDDFKEFAKTKNYEYKNENTETGTASNKKTIKIKVDHSDGSGISSADIINNILKEDAVKSSLDTDGSGNLSVEEIQSFIDTISGADGKGGSVSLNDVFAGIDNIKNGTYKTDTSATESAIVNDSALTGLSDIASAGNSENVFETLLQKGSSGKLSGKYTLNGKTYNGILNQNELNAMANSALNSTACTKYHPDKCLSIAYTYGLKATGDSNRSFSDEKVWDYGDASAYHEVSSFDKDGILSVVKSELDSGRPVVLQVNAGKGRHYVTVVGYNENAGSKLTENDLLIWDTYDSTLRSCGDGASRHMITGQSTGNGRTYGYQIFVRR